MRRKSRSVYYVCIACKKGIVSSCEIEAIDREMATAIFQKKHGIKPQIIYGGFYKRKKPIDPIEPKSVSITTECKTGIYFGWIITYMPLKENPKQAYALFDKRIDNLKMDKPNPSIINIGDIKSYEEIVCKANKS